MLAALCCCRRTTGATAEATNEQVTPAEWETPELLATRIEYDAIQLIRRLSRGTSREVWLGQFRDEHVAVKRLVSDEGSVKDAMEFAAEIEVMARLDHPKIVHFVGVAWKSTFKLQAAVEFMDSGDVRTLLESNQVVSSAWTNLKYHSTSPMRSLTCTQ